MDRRFSQKIVQRILARATELEANENDRGIEEKDLIEIASEAGIDSAALLQAIVEIESEDHNSLVDRRLTPFGDVTWREWASAVITPTLAGAFGLGNGLLTGIIRTRFGGNGVHVETIGGDLLIIAAAWVLCKGAKGKLRHLTFQTSNILLWLGFAMGFGSAFPVLAGDTSGIALLSAAVSGLVGAGLIWYRSRGEAKDDPDTQLANARGQLGHPSSNHPKSFDRTNVERAMFALRGGNPALLG